MSPTINPFSVKTPENLSSNDIASLFVEVFSDYPKLLNMEHTFLHGARGAGKSMMLRFMEPSVQIAAGKVGSISDLQFFAVHMPIKSSNYSLPELEKLEGAPYWLLSEHFLIINAASNIINSLIKIYQKYGAEVKDQNFTRNISDIFKLASCEIKSEDSNVLNFLESVKSTLNYERISARNYISRLAFINTLVPYDGTLFSYDDFFLSLIKEIRLLKLTPNGPIFLMVDDADNLSIRMQKILNGWVSYRTTSDICLKISTQQKYKTWRTSQEMLIESSHDFGEIDISTVYTSKSYSNYYDMVEKIVTRRLELAGITSISPIEFFPENKKQSQEIEIIKNNIAESWDNETNRVSSRKNDDIRRYTTSEYMKSLMAKKKSNLYSYAGFKSMVDISSGMIRFFLEPASRMYAEVLATKPSIKITEIPFQIQDDILYKWSEEYVLEEFEKLRNDETSLRSINSDRVEKLKKLVNSIGECFQQKLISNDSERQLISFMMSSSPSKNAQEVLDLAVEWGYFTKKTIAKKEGFGRNILYTMNRRLAPYFKLDPAGYAAHMSIQPEHIELAMTDSNAFLRERLKINNDSQQTLNF